MSSGTFSLMPGPFNPDILPDFFQGQQTPGTVAGMTLISTVCVDLAARMSMVPNAVIQAAYNRAVRDFCRRTFWLKRSIAIGNLTPNIAAYNFGTDQVLEIIGVEAAQIQQTNGSWIGLRQTDQHTYDPNMKPDIPNWYSYLPEGMIVYYPTPNLAYGYQVEVNVQPQFNSLLVPNDLLNKFNIYFESGAMWHLYLMDKEPWYNPTLASMAKDDFFEGIGMGKSWKDKGNQQGSVRATPRPFIAR